MKRQRFSELEENKRGKYFDITLQEEKEEEEKIDWLCPFSFPKDKDFVEGEAESFRFLNTEIDRNFISNDKIIEEEERESEEITTTEEEFNIELPETDEEFIEDFQRDDSEPYLYKLQHTGLLIESFSLQMGIISKYLPACNNYRPLNPLMNMSGIESRTAIRMIGLYPEINLESKETRIGILHQIEEYNSQFCKKSDCDTINETPEFESENYIIKEIHPINISNTIDGPLDPKKHLGFYLSVVYKKRDPIENFYIFNGKKEATDFLNRVIYYDSSMYGTERTDCEGKMEEESLSDLIAKVSQFTENSIFLVSLC